MKYLSIDLFSGAGGMSEGLRMAKFKIKFAFEIDPIASMTYKMNHKTTKVFTQDIRTVNTEKIRKSLKGQTIHLLAGCPPCQGFSSIRRLNRSQPVEDERNFLINEYVRFVDDLQPYTIMLENVPGLEMSEDFHRAIHHLKDTGYHVEYDVLNVKDYGVPQSRIHKIYPHHINRIQMLINKIPHDGGSLRDLDEEWQLNCHRAENVGFNDVYGRLRWDAYSTTITGGCLNPSKGRFLHPEQNRCITAREAAMLQTFPADYFFPANVAKTKIALMIGNALPPKFCKVQADNIREHLSLYLNN